jgi:hypothetical protein
VETYANEVITNIIKDASNIASIHRHDDTGIDTSNGLK